MNFDTHEIPCVILCGGKSSRMGEDKALLPFSNSTTLSAYQYDRLKPYFKNIFLSSKTNKFDFNANIIYDNSSDVSSPMLALKSILEYLNEKKVFILSVDTPFVSIEIINRIIDESIGHEITYAATSKDHFLCGVYSKSLLAKISDLLDEDCHKMEILIKNSDSKKVIFEHDMEFLNLNKKSDYEEAKRIID